jgi:hypothetical protein
VALRHTKMVRDLAALRAMVSSATESALGRSPNKIFRMEVVGELVAEFLRLEERCSQLKQPTTRIGDLLIGPPPS